MIFQRARVFLDEYEEKRHERDVHIEGYRLLMKNTTLTTLFERIAKKGAS